MCGCKGKSSNNNRNGLSKCSDLRNKLTNLKKSILMKSNATLDEANKTYLLNTSNEITVLLSNRYYCPTQEFIIRLKETLNL